MTDERLNLPSASAMERLALCPGSRKLEATQPDKRTDDSAAGDRAHELAARYFTSFHPEDRWPAYDPVVQSEDIAVTDVVGEFIEMARDVFAEWLLSVRENEPHAPLRRLVEVRLTMFGDGFRALTTGKPDLVWLCGRYALILDLKSLYGHHTASVKNLQLRTYAILVSEDQPDIQFVRVAICQPRVSKQPQTCNYTPVHLNAGRFEVKAILDASNEPEAPLIAGSIQCRNCRARGVCPAARDFAAIIPLTTTRVLARGEAPKLVAMLPIQERVLLWSNASTIGKILEAVEENLKEQPADVLAEVGLELVTSRGDREVKDPPAAYEALKDYLTFVQYNKATKLGITALQAVFRAATQLTDKEAKAKLEELLGDLLTRKPDKHSLIRLRGGPRPREVGELPLESTAVPQLENTSSNG